MAFKVPGKSTAPTWKPAGASSVSGRPTEFYVAKEGVMNSKKWIAGAIKHPGALHAQLGVPQGSKIPAKKLAKAAKAGGKLGQRARLAETLKGFH